MKSSDDIHQKDFTDSFSRGDTRDLPVSIGSQQLEISGQLYDVISQWNQERCPFLVATSGQAEACMPRSES